jgi:hypothetical protein
MALFYECMLKCAPILINNADIVREAMFADEVPRAAGSQRRPQGSELAKLLFLPSLHEMV